MLPQNDPPKWVITFLSWICPAHLFEEIEGDLIQKFERDVIHLGQSKAKRRFVWNGISFLRPGILLRNKFSFNLNRSQMVWSYFIMAYRQMAKGKAFTIINVLGLSVGLTAFFLIIQYASFEMSYDKWANETDDVYRVVYEQFENGELKNNSAKNFIGIRNLLKEHFPEIKSYTGIAPIPSNANFLFKYNGKIHFEKGLEMRADSSFFNVFPLLIKGNPSNVLNGAHSLAISESMATKIFGNKNALGEQLEEMGDEKHIPYTITGIFKDLPPNSHFHFTFITNFAKYGEWDVPKNYWGGPDYYTYFKLKNGSDQQLIENRLNHLLGKLNKEHPSTKNTHIYLQPISFIHQDSSLQDELEVNGSSKLVYAISIMGLLILVMAWINYVNLETARFVRRAKEVSVRRIIGSLKRELILQFFTEFFCMNILSFGLAVFLIQLLLPNFSYLTGIPISEIQLVTPTVWLIALGCVICGSILVGIIPALFLLRLNPILSLKGNFSGSRQGSSLRRVLITIQFTSSLVLIAFLLVVSQQLDYMRFTNKKIDIGRVIAVRNPTAYASQPDSTDYQDYLAMENTLMESPAIKMVSSSSALPGTEIGFTFINQMKRNLSAPEDPTRFKMLFLDFNFIPLYGLNVKAGRNYSIAQGDDKVLTRVIINESAARAIGFSSAKEAVGQVVNFLMWKDDYEKYEIIGVVEDYHHEAMKKEINPTIFPLNQNKFQQVYYSIKLDASSDPAKAVTYIEKSWKSAFPHKPFDYFFIDNFYDQQFKSELHVGRIFSLFAGLAVFIACLGILGMTLFEASSRLKEISIRKVLGATVSNLVALLSRGYFQLIFISTFLSVPLIYYGASQWLENYPERIELSIWFYLLPFSVIAILISVVSSFQTIKAARINPVENLKYE